MRLKTKKSDKADDLLSDLGDFIEEHFKKGIDKVEKMFKEQREKARLDDDDPLSYVRAFLDDKAIAAVMPSSRFIVERVIKAMELKKCSVVVEYGAAEGNITREILARLPQDGRLIAVEFNKRLFDVLQRTRDPRLITVHGDVRRIDQIARQHGVDKADAVVSGIPFAFLRGRERHELLLKTSELLNPGGRFVAYQVTTHLIPLLKDYFKQVKTQFELRNLPPHFVFTASN